MAKLIVVVAPVVQIGTAIERFARRLFASLLLVVRPACAKPLAAPRGDPLADLGTRLLWSKIDTKN